MKRIFIWLLVMALGLACLVCVSCRSHGLLSDDFSAGETVTPEALLDISRELFTEEAVPTEKETEPTAAETLSPDATVYWLESGSVYHADPACSHISHASPENIHEGDVTQAQAEGKDRLCAFCAP